MRRLYPFLFLPLKFIPLLLVACGTETLPKPSENGCAPAYVGQNRLETVQQVSASCAVTIEAPPLLPVEHVSPGVPLGHNSNPATSGKHFGRWASYVEREYPLDPGLYVHNLEHGGVVLFYHCDLRSQCPELATALSTIANNLPQDQVCSGEGKRNRVIVAPDPTLDTQVAVAAWGWLYKAACVDAASLSNFIAAHYGQGPECTCFDGTAADEP